MISSFSVFLSEARSLSSLCNCSVVAASHHRAGRPAPDGAAAGSRAGASGTEITHNEIAHHSQHSDSQLERLVNNHKPRIHNAPVKTCISKFKSVFCASSFARHRGQEYDCFKTQTRGRHRSCRTWLQQHSLAGQFFLSEKNGCSKCSSWFLPYRHQLQEEKRVSPFQI